MENNKEKSGKNSNVEMALELKKINLQLHIAEYSNLTGRCNNYMNIQSALVVGLIIWITVILNIWVSKPSYIYTWAGIFGFQIIEIILMNYVIDQYNIVRYLESSLKPQIKKLIKELIKEGDFWQYESFNKKLRGNGIMIWEIAEAIMSLLLILFAIIIRIKAGWSVRCDLIGLILNVALVVFIFYLSRKLKLVRKNFEKPI